MDADQAPYTQFLASVTERDALGYISVTGAEPVATVHAIISTWGS
jgi:hypothetical protein